MPSIEGMGLPNRVETRANDLRYAALAVVSCVLKGTVRKKAKHPLSIFVVPGELSRHRRTSLSPPPLTLLLGPHQASVRIDSERWRSPPSQVTRR